MHYAEKPTVVHSNTVVYIITQSPFDDVMAIATHYIITDESFNGIKGLSSSTLKVKSVISAPLETPNRTAICMFEQRKSIILGESHTLAFSFISMEVSQLAQAPLDVCVLKSVIFAHEHWLSTLVMYSIIIKEKIKLKIRPCFNNAKI